MRFNNTRESGMEVPLCFLQASNLELLKADFNIDYEVVGQSIYLRKVYVRSTSLRESIESANNLTFKLSQQIIQGSGGECWFEGVFGQNSGEGLYLERLCTQDLTHYQNQRLIRQCERQSE